jgi:hypothetical protein
MPDQYEEQDMDKECALCGTHLHDRNRAMAESDLCQNCAGENPTPTEDL